MRLIVAVNAVHPADREAFGNFRNWKIEQAGQMHYMTHLKSSRKNGTRPNWAIPFKP
jgi:hypothetical protein